MANSNLFFSFKILRHRHSFSTKKTLVLGKTIWAKNCQNGTRIPDFGNNFQFLFIKELSNFDQELFFGKHITTVLHTVLMVLDKSVDNLVKFMHLWMLGRGWGFKKPIVPRVTNCQVLTCGERQLIWRPEGLHTCTQFCPLSHKKVALTAVLPHKNTPQTCEFHSEFLNFKFISKFALIHLNISFLQIQILLCQLRKEYETLIINITFVLTCNYTYI